MNKNIIVKTLALNLSFLLLGGCFGGFKKLKVVDFTEQRVGDLSLTRKVVGKREFLFFSTTKAGTFLEGNIQGIITDYAGNPIEGVTVRVMSDIGRPKTGEEASVMDAGDAVTENANTSVNVSFAPGVSDTMGLFKIHFSLPVLNGNEVDVRGKLVYNPGWDQQKMNLGKAYEPQMKESPFRMYYNISTGFLAFAEGIRKVIVQPVGEGSGRLQSLPGAKAPAPLKSAAESSKPAAAADKTEEDLFKGFDFGQ
ncbi:MAG: hypothetical protein WCW52_00470 [Elusimicrobiales bacterium]|jgi:hypothetical protein